MGLLASPPEADARGGTAECRSNPYLPRARDQLDRLEFEPAARTLQRAVEHTRNCRQDLADIYRLKGYIDAINAERERCQRAFEILLALDPSYDLPAETPPKVRSCFDDALGVPAPRRRLSLAHTAPTSVAPNAPVALVTQVDDPLRIVDQVEVYFRRQGVEVYTVVTSRSDDTVTTVLPALSLPADAAGYEVEYFIRAVDRWEGSLAEYGSPRDPIRFAVQPGSVGESVMSSWWFWGGLGALAVGATVVAAVLVGQGGDTIPLRFRDGGAL